MGRLFRAIAVSTEERKMSTNPASLFLCSPKIRASLERTERLSCRLTCCGDRLVERAILAKSTESTSDRIDLQPSWRRREASIRMVCFQNFHISKATHSTEMRPGQTYLKQTMAATVFPKCILPWG